MRVSVQHVLAYATAILTGGTNGSSRYLQDEVVSAISKRIGQPNPKKVRVVHVRKDPSWATGILNANYAEDIGD